MANEWQVAAYAGLTVYGRIRRLSSGFWRRTDTGAFEAYNGANWLSYDHALTAEGEDRYKADLPGTLAAGYYVLEGRLQAGAGPVEADDGIISEEVGYWDGEAWTPTAPSSAGIYGTTGAVEFVYTVYEPGGVTPLPGVAVYVSSDIAGTNRSETQITDVLGRTTWLLDAGPAYFWRSHAGFSFTDPDLEEVEP